MTEKITIPGPGVANAGATTVDDGPAKRLADNPEVALQYRLECLRLADGDPERAAQLYSFLKTGAVAVSAPAAADPLRQMPPPQYNGPPRTGLRWWDDAPYPAFAQGQNAGLPLGYAADLGGLGRAQNANLPADYIEALGRAGQNAGLANNQPDPADVATRQAAYPNANHNPTHPLWAVATMDHGAILRIAFLRAVDRDAAVRLFEPGALAVKAQRVPLEEILKDEAA